MASKAAFFLSVLIRARGLVAARARLPKPRTSFLRSFTSISTHVKSNYSELLLIVARRQRVRVLKLCRKQCSDSLASGDARDDSGAPAICNYRGNTGCGRKFYCLQFRDHATYGKPAFFGTNETSCVCDISNHANPFVRMIHQSVNTCEQDQQFSFCQDRDLGREAIIVPEAQFLYCHRIVFVNNRHDVFAFEQTPQCVLRILMTGATVQVVMREQELRNVKLMFCEHRRIQMHQL